MNENTTLDIIKAESIISDANEWGRWMQEIPYIFWPEDMEVKAIPPFHGAIIRYNVRIKNVEDAKAPLCHIYLDCYDRLGEYGSPYWEVYPVDGDVARCDMEDIEELLRLVRQSLTEQAKELL